MRWEALASRRAGSQQSSVGRVYGLSPWRPSRLQTAHPNTHRRTHSGVAARWKLNAQPTAPEALVRQLTAAGLTLHPAPNQTSRRRQALGGRGTSPRKDSTTPVGSSHTPSAAAPKDPPHHLSCAFGTKHLLEPRPMTTEVPTLLAYAPALPSTSGSRHPACHQPLLH